MSLLILAGLPFGLGATLLRLRESVFTGTGGVAPRVPSRMRSCRPLMLYFGRFSAASSASLRGSGGLELLEEFTLRVVRIHTVSCAIVLAMLWPFGDAVRARNAVAARRAAAVASGH